MNPVRSAITPLEIATAIKEIGPSTIDEVARHVDASYESSRAQIAHMADQGLVISCPDRTTASGRPPGRWSLTRDGEHLFQKAYANLAIQLLEVLTSEAGCREQLEEILGRVVEERVKEWPPQLEGTPVEARMESLRSIYAQDDPFISIERGPDNRLRLIERNCPYYDVAQAHPELCGLTINIASQVLGVRVEREERFQDGDGRCVFVATDDPVECGVYITEM